MTKPNTRSRFAARILRSKKAAAASPGAFIVLPNAVSAKLPRRGRTTVDGTLNGTAFTAVLEPDGKKSHWLPLDEALLKAAGAACGEEAQFEIAAAAREREPEVPQDFLAALATSPDARTVWDATTTVARIDWIHWITSAKQDKTRAKRIGDACDMLASGKKRVCCFDPSGFYSKAFSAPESDADTLEGA